MEQKDKHYCKDCNKQIAPYVQRCYSCKTKWYDSYTGYFDKATLDEDFLYE